MFRNTAAKRLLGCIHVFCISYIQNDRHKIGHEREQKGQKFLDHKIARVKEAERWLFPSLIFKG